jgi:hypothetical protein
MKKIALIILGIIAAIILQAQPPDAKLYLNIFYKGKSVGVNSSDPLYTKNFSVAAFDLNPGDKTEMKDCKSKEVNEYFLCTHKDTLISGKPCISLAVDGRDTGKMKIGARNKKQVMNITIDNLPLKQNNLSIMIDAIDFRKGNYSFHYDGKPARFVDIREYDKDSPKTCNLCWYTLFNDKKH